MALFPIALTSTVLFNAALALSLLLRGSRSIEVSRTLQTALLVVILTVAEVVILMPFGLNGFGMLNVVWLQFVVVLPLGGVALWIGQFSGRAVARGVRTLATLALCPLGLWIHCRWVEPFDLRLERVAVALDPSRAGDRPLKIAVLSDLQTDRVSDYEKTAIGQIMAGEPDLVLVPGDLFHGSDAEFEHELPAMRILLGRLSASGGVWVVLGDADLPARIERILEGTSARFLRNERVDIDELGRRVTLLGIDYAGSARDEIAALEKAPGADDIRIVLAHRPSAVLELPNDSRIDLVVAGHTHGGQVRLPWLGPPIDLSPLPSSITGGGLHELDGRRVYVSRGVGMERGQAPRLRFNCPPEITLLTLE